MPVQRVLPNASFVELAARKAELGRELEARLHAYRDKLILTSVSGISEVGEPTVLPETVSDEELGRCVCDHLIQFDVAPPPDMYRSKLSDWSTLAVSGAKSAKAFESEAWYVSVRTIDTAIRARAAPRVTLFGHIEVSASSNANHATLGSAIRDAIRGAKALRAAGVV